MLRGLFGLARQFKAYEKRLIALEETIVAPAKQLQIVAPPIVMPELETAQHRYFSEYHGDEKVAVRCRLDARQPSRVLVRSADWPEASIQAPALSPDESRMALIVVSERDHSTQLLVATLRDDGDTPRDAFRVVSGTHAFINSVQWVDNDTLVYSHDASADALFARSVSLVSLLNDAHLRVYDEEASDRGVSVSRSQDDRYLLLHSDSHVSSEVRVAELAHAARGFPLVLFPRQFDSLAHVRHAHGRFFIAHDAGRLLGRVARLDALADEQLDWRARVPLLHDLPDQSIDSFAVYAQHVLLYTRRLDTGLASLVALKNFVDLERIETGAVAPLDFSSPMYATRTTSPIGVVPRTVWGWDAPRLLDLATLTVTQPSVPLHFQRGNDAHAFDDFVTVEHHLVPSRSESETVDVPMITVRARNAPLDGTGKCMQLVYGAFGDRWPFSLSVVELQQVLDAGFTIALCAARGGGERGTAWAADGLGANKRNTFSDTVACGEFLIANGFAARDALCLHGHSAGAFAAMGAISLRPTLYAAVVCTRPLVDASSDGSPLGALDANHWGSFSPTETLPELLETYGRRFPSMFFFASGSDRHTPLKPIIKFVTQLSVTAMPDDTLENAPMIYLPLEHVAAPHYAELTLDLKARIYAFATLEIERRRAMTD